MRFAPYRALTSLLMLTLLLSAGPGCSSVNSTQQHADVQTALQDFEKKNDDRWIKRLSSDQQRVTDLVGGRTKPYAGSPTEKAKQFLEENTGFFGPGFKMSDLTVIDTDVANFSAHVEYQQVFNNLAVENGRVKVNFDSEGRMVYFTSSYAPTANADDDVGFQKGKAVQIAIDEFLRTTPPYGPKDDEQNQNQTKGVVVNRDEARVKPRGEVQDVFFIRNERLRRAYKIVIDGEYPFGVKEFVIDASNGEVLHTRDFVYPASDRTSPASDPTPAPANSPTGSPVEGRGQVFIPNPANSLNKPLNPNLHLPYYNPNPYYTVVLPGVETVNGDAILKGPYVIIQDVDPPNVQPPTSGSPFEFIYEHNHPSFEEVMVYYHITRNQEYIQQLGLGDIANYAVVADAHACNGADQSEYIANPPAGKPAHLAFGDGNVNDAEDADIILHEYGHVIQYSQAGNAYAGAGQPKAMGEGFGDYWAFSSFYKETCESICKPVCPSDMNTLWHIGEWDKAPGFLRGVNDNISAASYDPYHNAHWNGRIWSQTLVGIFRTLGKTVADRLILESHFNV
ncbi:MAG TPA: hypothetical protein VFZ22_15535, partial [Pyrinomonadaceae bacterium]|nr:hypothetical protein [Pyrinomonadaceae bacterium]